MRREQILKICLNFFLTDEIELKRKDDNSFTFGANDFSDGEFEPTSFAIRFKNKEISEGFKKAIEDALAGNSSCIGEKQDGEADEKSQLVTKLKLPEKFFDYLNAAECAGCVGCNPDEYVYNANRQSEDNISIPLESTSLKPRSKPRRQSVDKHVSFKLADEKEASENEKVKQLFGTGNVMEKASAFGGGIKKSDGSTNIFAAFNADNPPQPTSIFGSNTGSIFGASKDFSTPGNSIFSSSLNTTPTVTTADSSTPFGGKPAEPFGGGLFGNKPNFSFNSAESSIFSGSNNKENGETAAKPFGAFSSTPVFGSSVFGSTLSNNANAEVAPVAAASVANIFGTATKSSFSFAEAAKELDKKAKEAPAIVPDFLEKSNDGGGFAALAASATPEKAWAASTAATGGFFGLTVKDDFFSKALNKQNNSEAADSSQNDESAHEENYDPHYDPIISLPDEVNVSTGEEEEEKLFGERAKLFRYDAKTKEWKERGEKCF